MPVCLILWVFLLFVGCFFVYLFFNGQRIKCNVWRGWEGDDFYSSMMFSWLPRRWSCLDSLGFSGLNEL